MESESNKSLSLTQWSKLLIFPQRSETFQYKTSSILEIIKEKFSHCKIYYTRTYILLGQSAFSHFLLCILKLWNSRTTEVLKTIFILNGSRFRMGTGTVWRRELPQEEFARGCVNVCHAIGTRTHVGYLFRSWRRWKKNGGKAWGIPYLSCLRKMVEDERKEINQRLVQRLVHIRNGHDEINFMRQIVTCWPHRLRRYQLVILN